MQYYDAKFLTSGSKKDEWPIHSYNEVVFAGRSNVGKSSLINCLCNRKKLAYTGNTPGKTRLLNFFEIDNKVVFVDIPGYGYANRSSNELIKFSTMIDEYFKERECLKLLILIVDMRHKPTKDDIDMIEYARDNHINTVVVANKQDKVKSSEKIKQLKLISTTLNITQEKIIQFSTITKLGSDKLWEKINTVL